MKKILLSFAVAISATLSHAQVIPNGDFEDPVASGVLPKWTAISTGVISTPTSLTVNSQTLPSNGGARFLFVQNNANYGIVACNKFALSTRPNTLRMQACYFPAGNDGFTIWIYMTKDTGAVNQPDTIMAGAVSFVGGRYPWQDLRVNLVPAYRNASNPDSAFIVIRAGLFQGSSVALDDIKFSTWTTSVTGVENHFQGDIEIYPNPVTSDLTNIKYQLNSESNVKIEVYDMQGKLVKSVFEGRETYGVYEKEINLEGLTSGMYTCKIIADEQVSVVKIIKN
jgi:hypothetical protein